MKRILCCLLAALLAGLAACQTRQIPPPESQPTSEPNATESLPADPSRFPLPLRIEEGAILLGDLSWGMNQDDMLSALGIPAEDMPPADSELTALIPSRQDDANPGQTAGGSVYYYLRDPSLLAGEYARAVTFVLGDCSYFANGDSTPRLQQIRVFYPYEGAQDLAAVQEAIRSVCGDPVPERLDVRTDAPPNGVSGPPWIQKTEVQGPERALWYSPGTWDTALTPGANDWMRRNVMGTASLSTLLSKEESTEIWQDDANWKMKTQNTFLTGVSLDASMENDFNRGDIPGLEGGPFLVITLEGQNACYVSLVNRQFPAS